MKRFLSLIGIGTLALLVTQPIQAKTIDKNKAFTLCKQEVKSEYFGASRYRLSKIKDARGEFRIDFMLSLPEGKQKVRCTINEYSSEKMLTEL